MKKTLAIVILISYSCHPAGQKITNFFSGVKNFIAPSQDISSNKEIQSLLSDFKKYITTNTTNHSGDLYEHSIWSANTIAKWWDDRSFWVEGLDQKDKPLTIVAGLLHDIGKGGDLIHKYLLKRAHPGAGFDYIMGFLPYYLDADGNTFDIEKLFKSIQMSDDDRKIIAILSGIHWDFGGIIMRGIAEKQDPEQMYRQYIEKLKDLTLAAHYNNGIVTRKLLIMSALIGASDVHGAQRVDHSSPLISFPAVAAPHQATKNTYAEYSYGTQGKKAREELLAFFDKHYTSQKELPALKPILEIPNYPGEKSQSDAHLLVPSVMNSVQELYEQKVLTHKKTIEYILAKERSYKDDYYALYNALAIDYFILHEVITKLYIKFFPLSVGQSDLSHYQAMRTPGISLFDRYEDVQDFLSHQITSYGVTHDTPLARRNEMLKELGFSSREIKKQLDLPKEKQSKAFIDALTTAEKKIDWDSSTALLSVNLSLFGNIGKKTKSECTFDYWVSDKVAGSSFGIDHLYRKVLPFFPLSQKKNADKSLPIESYIKEISKLSSILHGYTGGLYLILVPKEKINDISYFARSYGAPYGSNAAVNILFNRDMPKEERMPTFWHLLETDPQAALGTDNQKVSDVIDRYRRDITSIPNFNRLQLRLLVTNKELLSPSSGIRIYKYIGAPTEKLREYRKKRDQLVSKIFKEALDYNAQRTIPQNNPH